MTGAERDTLCFVADDLAGTSRTGSVSDIRGTFRITAARAKVLVTLAVELYGRLGIRACRHCACTDAIACEGGCYWATEDLCSSCAPRPRSRKKA